MSVEPSTPSAGLLIPARSGLPLPARQERIARAASFRPPAATMLVVAIAALGAMAPMHGATAALNPVPELHRGRVEDLATGTFLVARRNLPDPNFSETVILLAQFDAEGAMGLIVNRRSEIPLSRALGTIRGAELRTDVVYLGGPVAVTGAVALARSRTAVAGARQVFDDVQLITTREPLEAMIASGARPDTFRVYLGYAGWGASQLEDETALGVWHVFPADARVVFDPDPDSTWDRQIRRTANLMALGRPPRVYNGGL